MNAIDIYEDRKPKKRRRPWWQKLIILGVCALAAYAGLLVYWNAGYIIMQASWPRQDWSENMEAKDYFPDTKPGSTQDVHIIYPSSSTEYGDLSYMCPQLVEDGAIPNIGSYVGVECFGSYTDKGNLERLSFTFSHKGNSSRITVFIWPKLKKEYYNTTAFESTKGAQVTVRDGVEITCAGEWSSEKCARFNNSNGWYLITGSSVASFQDMAEVLDFFFTHPVDFQNFPRSKSLWWDYNENREYPGAFSRISAPGRQIDA